MNAIIRNEGFRTIAGVEGRAFAVVADTTTGRLVNQQWATSRRVDAHHTITATLRFDDSCKNGHATFSITGEVRDTRYKGDSGYVTRGCIHDEIAAHFPDLAYLIPWHLTSTDGPIHYIANTVYLAGDRDHYGLRAGEVRQIRHGGNGPLSWKLERVSGDDLPKYADGDTCPAETQTFAYVPWTRTGEGKARELDAARRVAVWPDATDAELCAEPDVLREALANRLPALLARFRADMDSCGFVWEVTA